jgi:hypothetical protein
MCPIAPTGNQRGQKEGSPFPFTPLSRARASQRSPLRNPRVRKHAKRGAGRATHVQAPPCEAVL